MALAVLATSTSPLCIPRPRSHSDSLRVAKSRDWNDSWTALPTPRQNRTDPDLGLSSVTIPHDAASDIFKALDSISALRLSTEDDEEPTLFSADLPTFSLSQDGIGDTPVTLEGSFLPTVRPFHRWMKSLHRRAYRHNHKAGCHTEPFPQCSVEHDQVHRRVHRKSSSDSSSLGFVTTVRSVTTSLASASVKTRRRRHGNRSSQNTRTDPSSRGSISGNRTSEDSVCFDVIMPTDPKVTERLLQRRRILEELIKTEEGYLGDLKFLKNVYVTILASLPAVHHGLRSSMNENLTDIIHLHEEILGELHRAVPHSEYTQPKHIHVGPVPLPSEGHHRWHSLDSVPEGQGGAAWLQGVPSVVAEPSIAAEVAQIFGKKMNRFLVYEEYGARYELMMKDIASADRSLPGWERHQRGIEALAISISVANRGMGRCHKSLTVGDLLVKPIQRLCRYPLLFSELLKCTPVFDCPNSYMEIDNVLIRLREVTIEMNRATSDLQMKTTLERTWLLQDRLVFPSQTSSAASKSTIRSFGHIRLCGALYIGWQTKDGVTGQYMITLLYKDCLCLATASKGDQIYTIQACISLESVKVEEADNGRGLQCHTSPFSWKLVFECDHQLYEMLMTACSQKEATEWRNRLSRAKTADPHNHSDPATYNSLYLQIKSLGTVFRKPGSVARRLSIHRATTIGTRSPLCQVILKNIGTAKEAPSSGPGSPIIRSQSLLTNSRIPVLTPHRAERARLEALLADVWSRRELPFPGMTTRSRSEHLVRTSASTMMRKLSAASLTHRFARRAPSITNLAQAERRDGDELPLLSECGDSSVDLTIEARAPSRSGTADDGSAQRLPLICDDIEQAHSKSSGSQAGDGELSNAGTVRRLDMTKVESIWGEEKVFEIPSRRATPRFSSRQNTPSMCSMEAKNPSCGSDNTEPSREFLRSPSRSNSRWARVGAINRGLMALSNRSFFH
ncbi:Dbl homology domain-containing protein [Xylariaceae sp. FL0594]|nr:Dbl homology domain-containing protein [Xylariaceae sp. FL0594]